MGQLVPTRTGCTMLIHRGVVAVGAISGKLGHARSGAFKTPALIARATAPRLVIVPPLLLNRKKEEYAF